MIGHGEYRAWVIRMERDGRCGRHACIAGLVINGKIAPEQKTEEMEDINTRLDRASFDTSEELARVVAPFVCCFMKCG